MAKIACSRRPQPRPDKITASDDLAARLKSLRAGASPPQQRGPDPPSQVDDDDLFAAVHPLGEDAARELATFAAAPTRWAASPLLPLAGGDDVARDLLGDARDVLARSRAWTTRSGVRDEDEVEEQQQDVDDVLARLVVDEPGLDDDDGCSPAVDERGPSPSSPPDELPRVPSRDPAPRDPDIIMARLAALRGPPRSLPSAPTSSPPPRRHETTWCAVCLDDASVRCRGCGDGDGDGVLYCARCWREAHLGPDVGGDVRGHPWTRYRKP